MLYTHLDIWTNPTDHLTWHAIYCPGSRDLSMGVLQPFEVTRIVAWAKSQGLTVTDKR